MRLKVLLITRNYPPKTGGLEVYSYNLIKEFESRDITYKIVLAKSIVHLVWFFPYCFLKALYLVRKYSIESIHLCDAFLSPIGVLLQRLTTVKVTVTVVGLDITYNNFLYQSVIPWCVARLEKIICISRSTMDACTRRGIPHDKCIVIPIGVRSDDFYLPDAREDLRCRLGKIAGVPFQETKILVTVGRLVKRKGIGWFVENVIPKLGSSYYYLIAGSGPEYTRIQKLIEYSNLGHCVFMLGRISDEEKKVIYNASDIFIMPNITVPGDMEGFGIVIIEAGICGLPVIASNIQGIRDAVIDGQTGFLVEECDVNGYIDKIRSMNLRREDIRSVVNSSFDWTKIYQQYHRVLMNKQISH